MYIKPLQFIPHNGAEHELRCVWPDGLGIHSAKCEDFMFRTKDTVKVKDGM